MKKTLTLLALTTAALMPMMPMNAKGETIWVTGVNSQDGWFDAEKDTKGGSGSRSDKELCWAASSSNIIAWWQEQQDYVPEKTAPTELNKIWNQYRDTFANVGGHAELGLHWWLDGSYEQIPLLTNGLDPKNGGYYAESLVPTPGYKSGVLRTDLQEIEVSSFKSDVRALSESLVSYINAGYGVELTWALPDSDGDGSTGGHSVTLWGVDYSEQLGRITNFYITDSDDYKTNSLTQVQINVSNDIAGNQTLSRTKYGDVYTLWSFTVLNSRLSNDYHYFNILDEESGNIIMKQNVDGEGYTLKAGTQEVNDIIFDNSRGIQDRLLTVEGEHAAETLYVNGSGTNTIDVTKGGELVVEQITGGQNLTKTGEGALEIKGGTHTGGMDIQQGDVVNSGNLGNVKVSGEGRLKNQGSAGVLTLGNGGVAEMKGSTNSTDTQLFTECEVADGGILKGSGTFGKVNVKKGGTLIVGNSPGKQSYKDELIVEGGTMVFSIDDIPDSWRSAASDTKNGWGSGTYSTLLMNNQGLTLNPDEIVFVLGSGVLESSTGESDLMNALGKPITVSLTNVYFLDELNAQSDIFNMAYADHLNVLEERTRFELSQEDGAIVSKGLQAVITPENIEFYTAGISIVMNARLNVVLSAAPAVPEPTTSTLSLLALASLCARRRRK